MAQQVAPVKKKSAVKHETVVELYRVLDDIDKNIKLFRKTREEMKEKYPKLFSSYEHH